MSPRATFASGCPMADLPRSGIVGAGFIGEVHARAVRGAGGVLAAVAVRDARGRVRRGDVGSLRLVHGSYLQDWLSRPEEVNWRLDASLGGGSRAFGDIGVHWCDVVEFA